MGSNPDAPQIDPREYEARSRTRVKETIEFAKSPDFTRHLLVLLKHIQFYWCLAGSFFWDVYLYFSILVCLKRWPLSLVFLGGQCYRLSSAPKIKIRLRLG